MMRIAIAGASGRMGRTLIELVSQSADLSLAAALDVAGSPMLGQDACAFLGKPSGVLITDQLSALKGAECLIDFTRPEGSLLHLTACTEFGVNLVLGTTGFDEAGKAAIAHAADMGDLSAGNCESIQRLFIEILGNAGERTFAGHEFAVVAVKHRAPRIRMTVAWSAANHGEPNSLRVFN